MSVIRNILSYLLAVITYLKYIGQLRNIYRGQSDEVIEGSRIQMFIVVMAYAIGYTLFAALFIWISDLIAVDTSLLGLIKKYWLVRILIGIPIIYGIGSSYILLEHRKSIHSVTATPADNTKKKYNELCANVLANDPLSIGKSTYIIAKDIAGQKNPEQEMSYLYNSAAATLLAIKGGFINLPDNARNNISNNVDKVAQQLYLILGISIPFEDWKESL